MGTSTISMVMFNSYVGLADATDPVMIHDIGLFWTRRIFRSVTSSGLKQNYIPYAPWDAGKFTNIIYETIYPITDPVL